jgi:two-component sensor histidine kinase
MLKFLSILSTNIGPMLGGECNVWPHPWVSLHMVTDGGIALAFTFFCMLLVRVTRLHQALPYGWVTWLWSLFFGLSATSHFLALHILHPSRPLLSGSVKLLTAVTGFLAMMGLLRALPGLMTSPSRAALQRMQQTLRQQIVRQKNQEDQIRQALNQKETLLREVHHRVKNNLQVVSSLLYLQAQQLNDPNFISLFNESQNRIMTISLLHETLCYGSSVGRINLKDYIRDVVHKLHGTLLGKADIAVIIEEGPALLINIDAAMSCGLIVNELVTNALQHAYPADAPGSVEVHLKSCTQHITVVVKDNGCGISSTAMRKPSKTLGLSLVQSLAQQLSGTVTFATAAGTTCTLNFAKPADTEEIKFDAALCERIGSTATRWDAEQDLRSKT